MDLSLTFFRGSVIISPSRDDGSGVVLDNADIRSLTVALAQHLRALVIPTSVTKPRGTRGFSFHWSNAQASWDVVAWNDPSWRTDGAEFLVYFTKDALSPLGKPWSLKEMQYVAKMLPEHPGYASSMESSSRRAGWVQVAANRVAAKFLSGKTR